MDRRRLLALNALALSLAAGVLGALSPSPRPACAAANACDAALFSAVGQRLWRGDGEVYGPVLGLSGAPELPFLYPPTAFPWFALWGLGPAPALSALNGALGALALGLAAARLGGPAVGVAAMAGGWAYFSAWLGQTGLWVGALACALARPGLPPRWAGLALAGLALKPQLGLFAGLALLAAGQRRVVLYAAAWTAVFAGVSAAIFGVGPWRAWAEAALAGAAGQGPALDRGFMSTWHALVPGALGSSPGLGFGMLALGLVIAGVAGRGAAPEKAAGAALVSGALFAPHGHPYDLAVWVPALWGRGPAAILGAGALVHLCVLAGVRAPLALFGAWLLWDQIRSADQRSG